MFVKFFKVVMVPPMLATALLALHGIVSTLDAYAVGCARRVRFSPVSTRTDRVRNALPIIKALQDPKSFAILSIPRSTDLHIFLCHDMGELHVVNGCAWSPQTGIPEMVDIFADLQEWHNGWFPRKQLVRGNLTQEEEVAWNCVAHW